MSTFERPSLVEAMEKHSTALWVLLADASGVLRGVPIYEPVAFRELVIRGHMVPTVTITTEGQWEYRPSRQEGEWRADLDLDQRKGAHCMAAYPKPLGVFTKRARVVYEEAEIHAMWGEVAA